jgi:hypothetical protein
LAAGPSETPAYLRLFHQPLDIGEVRLVGERELEIVGRQAGEA